MILLVSGISFNTYLGDPAASVFGGRSCPDCGRRLTKHGYYFRWVFFGSERIQIRIFRLRCRPCGLSFSLLPDFLVPYFRYHGTIIEQAVTAYLSSRASYRGVAVALSDIELPATQSVTDTLLFARLRPSYQRVFAWVSRLSSFGKALSQTMLRWALRLRADHPILHVSASPLDAVQIKARSPGKTDGLRAAATVRAMAAVLSTAGDERSSWMRALCG